MGARLGIYDFTRAPVICQGFTLLTRFIPFLPAPARPDFIISKDVRRQIIRVLGHHKPERGGLLGGCRSSGAITHFWHDQTPRLANASTYEPDHVAANAVLRTWNAQGVDLVGMVHSHPGTFSRPSSADCEYARRILEHIPAMHQFFMPIVLTRPDARQARLHPYVVRRGTYLAYEPCELQTR